MRELIKEFVKIVAEILPVSEPIYDFGALQTPGQEGFADLRPVFPGKKYIGCDLREGPGVDLILNFQNVELPSESAGTVLSLDTLEHVEFPRKAMNEAYRILKPDGILIISSVMNFSIHDYPYDYWRFTPEGFKSLLKAFPSSIVDFAGEENFPHTVIGIGFKKKISEKNLDSLKKKFEVWKNTWNISVDNTPKIVSDAIAQNEGFFKLDLGCGKFKREGFIGIDIENEKDVDIVYDLNKGIPFPDNYVDQIYCSHCLEHVRDPHFLMSEMYRVSIPNAYVEIIIPLHEATPKHLTVFDEQWFKNNIDPRQFIILSTYTGKKSGISVSGKQHSWIQQEISLRAVKDSCSSTDIASLPNSKNKDAIIQITQLKKDSNIAKNDADYRSLLKYSSLKNFFSLLGSWCRAIYTKCLRLSKNKS
jgi:ubiquinone/menaquinone biosynthesis C-methylase UbiE